MPFGALKIPCFRKPSIRSTERTLRGEGSRRIVMMLCPDRATPLPAAATADYTEKFAGLIATLLSFLNVLEGAANADLFCFTRHGPGPTLVFREVRSRLKTSY